MSYTKLKPIFNHTTKTLIKKLTYNVIFAFFKPQLSVHSICS